MNHTMIAIEHQPQPGSQPMTLTNIPRPEPKTGEVLIAVAWAGINRPDILQKQGLYPAPPHHSPLLGLEVSGQIVAIGEHVDHWQIGDWVCALTPGGGYAEYVVAPAAHCLPIPSGMSLKSAACLPETFFTVWNNVFERGHLRAGETFLVHAGASGIGLTAIQLATAFGAHVLTTISTPLKGAACLAAGAEKAIVYTDENFVDVVKSYTDNQGVNMILDMVGGDYIARNLRCLALDGRLLQIAFLRGSQVEVNWMTIMMKRLTITGSTLRAQSIERKAHTAHALQQHVWPLLASGQCHPLIHAEFPLEQASQAHQLMQSNTHIGKIVLRVMGDQLNAL